MHETVEGREKRRLREVAREYRDKGYDVVLRPDAATLPACLAGFRIDLLARSPTDNVLVEIRSQQTLAGATDLAQMAEAVSCLPGWRLELVVTNPREKLLAESGAEPLTGTEIRERLAQVRELIHGGRLDAAALLAWSATEGALRRLAREEAVALEDPAPLPLVKQLYSLGIVSRADYDTIVEAIPLRNTLAHGYQIGRIDPDVIRQLVHVVGSLVGTGSEEQVGGSAMRR